MFAVDGLEPSACAIGYFCGVLCHHNPSPIYPLNYTTNWSRVLESNQSSLFCRQVITTSYVTQRKYLSVYGWAYSPRFPSGWISNPLHIFRLP